MHLTFGELTETPLGPISFIAGDNGLQRMSFLPLKLLKAQGNYQEGDASLKGLETISALLVEINEFLFGIRKEFSVDVDWNVVQGFQREVLQLTYGIPYGEFLTYGEIAAALDKPGSARAVGRALSNNPIPIVIPCHRVIGADGYLRGYAAPGGVKAKSFLLELEGQKIEGGRVTAH